MKGAPSNRTPSRGRRRKRAILAFGLAIPTLLIVWFVPWGFLIWKLGWRPVVRQHMTVVERDGWYWNVTVVDSSRLMRFTVSASPTNDAGRAARQMESWYQMASEFDPPEETGGLLMAKPAIHRSDAVPRWAKISADDPTPFGVQRSPGLFTYTFHQTAIGWPLRAFRGERVWAFILSPTGEGGSTGPSQNRNTTHGFVELGAIGPVPYLPIWRGLVLDLLVFMLPWYLLLWGVGASRRRRRSRRGRCAECNYDMTGLEAGSPCPECGTERGR